MRSLRSLLTLLVVLLALLSSCSKTPSHVIPEDKMAEIIADINVGNVIVDAERSQYRDDSSRMVLMQSIYARHGVDAAMVDTSLVWYGHNIDRYVKVCEKAEEILTARIEKVEQSGGKTSQPQNSAILDGDSVNLWPGVPTLRIAGSPASDFQSFMLTSDRSWDRGDRYTLSAKGINTQGNVTMYLAADYNDGTTEFITSVRPAENVASLLFVVDSSKVANRVYGSLYYHGSEGEIAYLDSITLVRTRGRNDNVAARKGQHITHNR